MACKSLGISCGFRELRIGHGENKFRFAITTSFLSLIGLVACPLFYTRIGKLSTGRFVYVNRFHPRYTRQTLELAEHLEGILKSHVGDEVYCSPLFTADNEMRLHLPCEIPPTTYSPMAEEIAMAIRKHNQLHRGIDPFCLDY